MKNPNIYSAFAVILPVALGLGLVYLTIVGRLEPASALGATLGLAALIGVAVFLRDFCSDQEIGDPRK